MGRMKHKLAKLVQQHMQQQLLTHPAPAAIIAAVTYLSSNNTPSKTGLQSATANQTTILQKATAWTPGLNATSLMMPTCYIHLMHDLHHKEGLHEQLQLVLSRSGRKSGTPAQKLASCSSSALSSRHCLFTWGSCSHCNLPTRK